MRALLGHVGALLVHAERRSLRIASLAALLLALGVSVLLPYGRPPSTARAGDEVAKTAKPRKAFSLPEPSLADREGQAVDKYAGAAIRKGGAARRLVALTFDDGPGPYTEQVLKTLTRLKVPATFFQVGRVIDDFPDAAARESERAETVIGDHTYDHAAMSKLGRDGQEQQILEASKAMLEHGEAQPRLFRPPYGMWDETTRVVTRKRGMAMVLWSVDSKDYERPGVDVIVSTVMREVQPGAIILMHDAGGERSQTIAAIPKIVRRLRAQGYGFVTVPKLLYEDPPSGADLAEPGEVVGGEGAG